MKQCIPSVFGKIIVLIFKKSYYWHIEIELSMDLESQLTFNMSDLDQIRSKIAITEADLAEAKKAGDRELILMYGNQLIEQQKEKNILLANQGKFQLLSLLFAKSNTFFQHL